MYVSAGAHGALTEHLRNRGAQICVIQPDERVGPLVRSHPDIFICKTNTGAVFADRSRLGPVYPQDIPYNALFLDRYAVHNLKYSAPEVLAAADREGLQPVHVKQGYTKCSCVYVTGSAVITADEGIYAVLASLGDVDVLKVRPGFVLLPGADTGFLGGASGKAMGELLFNGDLDTHPDAAAIRAFCEDKEVAVRDFPGLPLTDIGSVIEV